VLAAVGLIHPQVTNLTRTRFATDYHVNESPMMHQPHFKHLSDNDIFLRPEDLPRFDEVIGRLLKKAAGL
jgi:hypothetical protein